MIYIHIIYVQAIKACNNYFSDVLDDHIEGSTYLGDLQLFKTGISLAFHYKHKNSDEHQQQVVVIDNDVKHSGIII